VVLGRTGMRTRACPQTCSTASKFSPRPTWWQPPSTFTVVASLVNVIGLGFLGQGGIIGTRCPTSPVLVGLKADKLACGLAIKQTWPSCSWPCNWVTSWGPSQAPDRRPWGQTITRHTRHHQHSAPITNQTWKICRTHAHRYNNIHRSLQ
jgi:hypothetical protein